MKLNVAQKTVGRELLIAEVYTGEKKREYYENIINMLEAKVEYYKKKI